MKKEKAKCTSTKYRKHVYPYGSNRPLPTLGKFEARVQTRSRTVEEVEFIVIDGVGRSILGR
jgi:hypothetical protein